MTDAKFEKIFFFQNTRIPKFQLDVGLKSNTGLDLVI